MGFCLVIGMNAALHELDPAFRKVTLENERLKALVRDLQFHKDPVGKSPCGALSFEVADSFRIRHFLEYSVTVYGNHEAD